MGRRNNRKSRPRGGGGGLRFQALFALTDSQLNISYADFGSELTALLVSGRPMKAVRAKLAISLDAVSGGALVRSGLNDASGEISASRGGSYVTFGTRTIINMRPMRGTDFGLATSTDTVIRVNALGTGTVAASGLAEIWCVFKDSSVEVAAARVVRSQDTATTSSAN